MGQVFYFVKKKADLISSAEKKRFWMVPGYPQVVLPGVVLTAYVDRTDEGARIRLVNANADSLHSGYPLQYFRIVPRAFEVDEDKNPTRIFVEMAFIERCSHAVY